MAQAVFDKQSVPPGSIFHHKDPTNVEGLYVAVCSYVVGSRGEEVFGFSFDKSGYEAVTQYFTTLPEFPVDAEPGQAATVLANALVARGVQNIALQHLQLAHPRNLVDLVYTKPAVAVAAPAAQQLSFASQPVAPLPAPAPATAAGPEAGEAAPTPPPFPGAPAPLPVAPAAPVTQPAAPTATTPPPITDAGGKKTEWEGRPGNNSAGIFAMLKDAAAEGKGYSILAFAEAVRANCLANDTSKWTTEAKAKSGIGTLVGNLERQDYFVDVDRENDRVYFGPAENISFVVQEPKFVPGTVAALAPAVALATTPAPTPPVVDPHMAEEQVKLPQAPAVEDESNAPDDEESHPIEWHVGKAFIHVVEAAVDYCLQKRGM